MEILSLLQNRDIQTNLLIIFIGISLIQFFDMKIIVSIIVFILIVLNYNNVLDATSTKEQIKQEIKQHEISDDMYYNTAIHDDLVKLKKFKKYNKVAYKDGVKYMRKFFKTLHILEHDEIYNYNQYFENALMYLKTSINHFQSITVSLPERDYINGIKYGDFESTKKTHELGELCKDLYNECYYVLTNLAVKFNETWSSKPNIYTKEIDINSDRVERYNETDEINWALF